MASGKYLVPPEEDEKNAELWKLTWKRLERFLPDLHEELFRASSQPELDDAATKTDEKKAEEGREEAKPPSSEEAKTAVAATLEDID